MEVVSTCFGVSAVLALVGQYVIAVLFFRRSYATERSWRASLRRAAVLTAVSCLVFSISMTVLVQLESAPPPPGQETYVNVGRALLSALCILVWPTAGAGILWARAELKRRELSPKVEDRVGE
jgi:hypothetical protein